MNKIISFAHKQNLSNINIDINLLENKAIANMTFSHKKNSEIGLSPIVFEINKDNPYSEDSLINHLTSNPELAKVTEEILKIDYLQNTIEKRRAALKKETAELDKIEKENLKKKSKLPKPDQDKITPKPSNEPSLFDTANEESVA